MEQASEASRSTAVHALLDLQNPAAGLWRDLLVREHLAADQQLALYGCSKGTKDLVLRTARRATVTLHLDKDGVPLQPDLLAYRVSMVSRDLRMRGQLATKVTLRLESADSGPLTLALVGLQEGAAHVHCLDMTASGALPRSLLETAGRCCSNLTALMLTGAVEAMPSPSHLPHLRSLTMLPDAQSLPSVRPYLSHLSHLHLKRPLTNVLWLLQPATITTTLHTLTLERGELHDQLLGLLLTCAPALEELNAHSINLQSDALAASPCNWRRLTCNCIRIVDMARLPQPTGITITPREFLPCFKYEQEAAAAAAAVSRFKERHATLVYRNVFLWRGDVVEGEQPAMLRRYLELLRGFPIAQANGAVRMVRWTMSAALMRELPGLPRLSTLSLELLRWRPEPMVYAPLLRLVPDSFETVQCGQSSGLSTRQLEDICFGAPFDRTAEHPLSIEFASLDANVIASINQRLQHSGYHHVTVKEP